MNIVEAIRTLFCGPQRSRCETETNRRLNRADDILEGIEQRLAVARSELRGEAWNSNPRSSGEEHEAPDKH